MLLILFGILLIGFATICWKWLDFGLAIVVFCLPAYLLRINIGPLPSTLLELLILVLVLIFVIKKITNKEIKQTFKNWKILLRKWWLPIILFLIAATISVFTSLDFKHGLGRWRAYFVEPFMTFLILLDVVKTKKQWKLIIWALGLSSLFISLSAIVQYIFNIMIPADYDLPNLKRATSFYGYPNAIGLYVAPIVTLFCGLIVGMKQKNNETKKQIVAVFLFYCLIVLFGVFAIILAVSKGAIFGIFVGLFFMMMLTKWRWWTLGVTFFLIALTLIVPQARNKVVPIVTFQEVSGDVRIVLWQGTWNLIKSRPIFGAGLAGFQKAYPNYKLAKHTEILVYPHNIILNFWVETGLLGLLSFIGIMIVFFWQGFKNSKNNFISVVLMGSMVCIIAHGIVDVPYFKNDLSILFWVIVGLMVLIPKIKE